MADPTSDLATIRQWHEHEAVYVHTLTSAPMRRAHDHRGVLLAIVDELTAELAESRAALRPDVGSIVVDSNGNEAVVLGYNHAGVALVGTSAGHIEDARRRADADPDPLTLDGGAA